MNTKLILAILLVTGATVQGSSYAQTYPDRPIKLIVPYTPGGGTDTVARMITEKISTDLRWTILVDNKPGGGGNIGMDYVAKAKPDGYTIGMGQTSNLAINPAAISKMPFDATRDFTPVALIAEVPMAQLVILLVRCWPIGRGIKFRLFLIKELHLQLLISSVVKQNLCLPHHSRCWA